MQTLPERPLAGARCKEQNGSSSTWAENQAAAQQLARGARAVSLINGFPALRTGRWSTSVKEDLPWGVNSPRGCLGSGKKRARAERRVKEKRSSMVPAGTAQYEPGSPAWRRKGLMLMRTENTIDYRLL